MRKIKLYFNSTEDIKDTIQQLYDDASLRYLAAHDAGATARTINWRHLIRHLRLARKYASVLMEQEK
jgi:hypothetical protein